MIKYKKLTEKQKQGFDDFLGEALFLTEEENSAIEHQTEMTQELFEQCLVSLARIGSIRGFNRLYDELSHYTNEEQAMKEELKAHIRKNLR